GEADLISAMTFTPSRASALMNANGLRSAAARSAAARSAGSLGIRARVRSTICCSTSLMPAPAGERTSRPLGRATARLMPRMSGRDVRSPFAFSYSQLLRGGSELFELAHRGAAGDGLAGERHALANGRHGAAHVER